MLAAAQLGSHVFWITSRAFGTVALVLSSGSVAVGVTMGGRLTRGRGPDLRVTHEALSIAAIVALVLHAAVLLGDSYFHPGILDLTVPFARNYREPYMALGIIAGWAMILLGLSYYARTRIGMARWRVLHRLTALAWALGVVHTLGEGSDAGQAWFLTLTALTVVAPLVLILVRVAGLGRRPGGALETG
jgi:methionine sulfoxide reductase heme-binding subunit